MLQRGKSSIAQIVVIILLVCMMAGCTDTASRLLPPGTGYPKDYETVNVAVASDHTLNIFSSGSRSSAAQVRKWCTVGASIGMLRTDRAHSAEYHAGWAYFMTEPVSRGERTLSSSSVYACDATGTTRTIVDSSRTGGIMVDDFSVSPDGRYVILYQATPETDSICTLRLWSVERQRLVGPAFVTGYGGNDAVWDIPCGNGLWHELPSSQGKPASYEYVVTHVGVTVDDFRERFIGALRFTDALPQRASMTKYPVPGRISFTMRAPQIIDPSADLVAYDDCPFFVTTDGENAFDATRSLTHLYLYDFRTGASVCVDQRPVCNFAPQWIGPGVVEYNIASDPWISSDPSRWPKIPTTFSKRYVIRHVQLPLRHTESSISVLSRGLHEDYVGVIHCSPFSTDR